MKNKSIHFIWNAISGSSKKAEKGNMKFGLVIRKSESKKKQ